jgi:hypothetical protein
MRTVKWNPLLSGVAVLLGSGLLWTGAAQANVTTTNAAAILVFPKIVVDTTSSSSQTDTIIQVTNVSEAPVTVRCFYVNANGHCSNDPTRVCPVESLEPTCGDGFCIPGWTETDFIFRLTPKQPIVWSVSDGLPELPLASFPGPFGDFNSGSIPKAPEDPLLGELRCVQVGDDELPTDENSLVGLASIETVSTSDGVDVDVAGYNAIGLPAKEGQNNRDDTLVLGEEYSGCPSVLVADHFFDGALVSEREDEVRTQLTFVPCSADFFTQVPKRVTVQFLVFNEFEQRFSTSRAIECVTNVYLSDLASRPGPSDDQTSIFHVAVQGTLTGQTIARGVSDDDETTGEGILVQLHEIHDGEFSAAFAAHRRGSERRDVIQLPAAGAPSL